MDIGIIGSGNIGATVARLAVDAGHTVTIANSRGPHTLQALVEDLGDSARAGTVEDAAAAPDLVLIAIPLRAYTDLDAAPFAERIVLDAGNYYPNRDGRIAALEEGTVGSSELVKAFNTIYFKDLGARADRDADSGDRVAVPVAGDDADAKQTVVVPFIESLGLAPVDIGGLAAGRDIQPGAEVYATTLTPTQLRAALEVDT
jgi:predicted dinucleotide-binding enzyme